MKPLHYSILAVFLLGMSPGAWALDSYRYLHVTVDTPWNIFIFLLMAVFAPFILMAVLAWYFSFKKKSEPTADVEAQHEDRP